MLLAIEYRKRASLTPYPMNTRTHSAEQINQIAESMRQFGFVNPILIDPDGGIIAGEGRYYASEIAGIDPVPCIVLAGLSAMQRRAYVIADNRIALNSGWDLDKLATELSELVVEDFNVDVLGFSDDDLQRLLADGTGVLPEGWQRPAAANTNPTPEVVGGKPDPNSNGRGRSRLIHTCPNCGVDFN